MFFFCGLLDVFSVDLGLSPRLGTNHWMENRGQRTEYTMAMDSNWMWLKQITSHSEWYSTALINGVRMLHEGNQPSCKRTIQPLILAFGELGAKDGDADSEWGAEASSPEGTG